MTSSPEPATQTEVPPVQAEFAPDRALAQRRSAERQYRRERTERRRRVFGVFFAHVAPGTSLAEKTAAAHALIVDSDAREQRSLFDLLARLRALYSAVPPEQP